MTLNDRLTRGFLAGLLAGIIQSASTLPLYSLKLTKYRWLDFATIVTFGDRAKSGAQAFVSEIITYIWSGLLGTGYAYMLPRIGERNRRYKGIAYGVSTWFSIHSIVHLLHLKPLTKVDKRTATIHSVISACWGLVLDQALDRMEQMSKHTSSFAGSPVQSDSSAGAESVLAAPSSS